MRATKRRSCSSCADLQPEFNENDAARRVMYFSISGTDLEKALVLLFGCTKPITFSTPARLYQLRSKMTISPAAGKCSM